MEMTSSIVPSEESQRAVQVRAITYIYMDKDLFNAAATADMDLFNKYRGDFRCLVDGMKNTALHIYFRIGLDEDKTFLGFWLKSRFTREINMKFVGELLGKCPSLLLQPNEKGEIPLHFLAEKEGILEVVKFIIERTKLAENEDMENGLEPTNRMKQMLRMRDEDGNTAFHRAANKRGEAELVGLLGKELGANDFAFFADNKRGETPLYIAARLGHHRFVAEILDHCKSTAHGGPNGATALHAAVLRGDERIVKKLIVAKKQLIRETDDKGRTPLHYAAHFGRRSAVKQLLAADATAAYITDKERGMTALHMAAWQGHLHIMVDIISYCPSCCEIVDKNYGWNFLHFAAITLGELSLLKGSYLVRTARLRIYQAEIFFSQKDNNGITPYDVKFFLEYDHGIHPILSFLQHLSPVADFVRPGGLKISEYYMMNAQKKKQIREILEEIGNNAEVAGLQVHKSFRVFMEDNPSDVKEIVKKTRESHLVVATLVATVTFTAALTIPGGYNSKSGTAILGNSPAFKAFIITDALAFVTSLLAITLYFFSAYMDRAQSQHFVNLIVVADCFTGSAVAGMMVAFSTGTYAVLESYLGIAIATCSIGLTYVVITYIVLFFLFMTLTKNASPLHFRLIYWQ